MAAPKLLNLSYPELDELFRSMGEPGWRADQVLGWVYGRLASSFEEMTDLPIPLRAKLQSGFRLLTLKPLNETVSADGKTRKVLFRMDDGRTIESGLMLYGASGTGRERRTVCVSTQVGCAIRCPFCATGQQGFERNLEASEIIEQVLYFMRLVWKSGPGVSARRPVTNVVFMGMGEPLANYAALVQSIGVLNSSTGLKLGARQMSVSTAGLVPQIRRLAREPVNVELAVSLHAPDDGLRDRLVPVNRRYPLESLLLACGDYSERTGRRPTFEYALFDGVNDSIRRARELSALLRGLNCHVNLIAGNATNNASFKGSPEGRVRAFKRELNEKGISATVRLARGRDIEAGCGQLRSRSLSPSSISTNETR